MLVKSRALIGRQPWIIKSRQNHRTEALTIDAGVQGSFLAIFSFEEEALLFLRLGGLEGLWRTSETDAATLAKTCSGVECVVLDPFPEIGFDALGEAVSLRWGMFLDLFGLPRQPAWLPPHTG